MKKIATLFLFSVLYIGAFAQTQPAWVKFSGPSNYANYDVQEVSTGIDSAGNIYTAGSMIDTVNNLNKIMLVKYNAAGTQQWIQYYDNNDPNYNGSYLVKLLVDKAGNCYLCGYGKGTSTNNKDFLIVKYDNAGNNGWSSYLDGGTSGDDYVTSACFDHAGNIIMAGYINHQSGTDGDDIMVAKWEPGGTYDWGYTWNNSGSNDEDRALAVASDTNNNIFATGYTYQNGTKRDIVTIKVSAIGMEDWVNIYSYNGDGNDDRGYSVTTDAAGNSYVTGAAADWTTVKYDPSGNTTWQIHYATLQLERYASCKVLLDRAGNVITVGTAFKSTSEQDNYVVSKYTSAGVLIWSTDINSPAGGGSIETFYDAQVDSAGYVYITGKYDGLSATDILTAIVSPNGGLVWNTPFTNSVYAAGADHAYCLALDNSNNIIISGVSETRNSGSANPVDIVTFKYNAPNLTLGIFDVADNGADVSVFPNPTHGALTVKLNDESLLGADVTVTNVQGQTVLAQKITSTQQVVSLNDFASGMYLLNVKSGNSIVSKKIIVE